MTLIKELLNFILDFVNTPIEFLLHFTKSLLANPIDPSAFAGIWVIIVYILSMFYGLLLLYSGFSFIISGYDAAKREEAKEWLKNVLIMIFLVQASYLIYVLILDINSALTTSIFSLIDKKFFVFTATSFSETVLEIVFGATYLLVLIVTIIILAIRYLIVSFGVALFPIGIFLYFMGPLQGYGKSLLSFLFINIFMSFFAALIFLMSSLLLKTSFFTDAKIILMIASFVVVDILGVYFLLYSLIIGAVNTILGSKGLSVVKRIKGEE